jgi:putative heme-binding domain-containing protein
MKKHFIGIGLFALLSACGLEKTSPEPQNEFGIQLPKGFEIERLYQPGAHEQGSWVSLVQDDAGNFYTSDQFGNLYKMILGQGAPKVEKLDLTLGMAQGLLWHNQSLYALVNAHPKNDMGTQSGFYKIIDSNTDQKLDSVITLRHFEGHGEHGPHSLVLGPDGNSIYMVAGNYTKIPKDLSARMATNWQLDNVLPVILDPSGHANELDAHGGWVAKTDLEGNHWELFSIGMRNTYDIAFNADGELFGFDSDMEYDLGMPWYRPIRMTHITAGSQFGWRTGTAKFHEDYPDNLPGIADLGQGSPTGVVAGMGLKFPTAFQKGVFLLDWSYGTLYFADLNEVGSSYSAKISEFLSGVPLPLTDAIVGQDGHLYFLTGGRRLESAMYRVRYTGQESTEKPKASPSEEALALRKLRKQIETYQKNNHPEAIPFLVEHMGHSDRFIRFAARTALENQDSSAWINQEIAENTHAQIEMAVALAHKGTDAQRTQALENLIRHNPKAEMVTIRAIGLLVSRMEAPLTSHTKKALQNSLKPLLLQAGADVNREVVKLLSYLQDSSIIDPVLTAMETDTLIAQSTRDKYLSAAISGRSEQYGKDVANMLANMPNDQHISYAKSLSVITEGWTKKERDRYFDWFQNALQKSGGKMYNKFILAIQREALPYIPENERPYYESLAKNRESGATDYLKGVEQPEGPGKAWTSSEIIETYENRKGVPDFKSGSDMFRASLCINCHSMDGIGGNTGPDLSTVGTRFSLKDLALAIAEPSETISDRYEYTEFTLKNGNTVSGRVLSDVNGKITLSTSAFSPEVTTTIARNEVVKEMISKTSPMPNGLVNRLNETEMVNLITYILQGGKRNPDVY